MEKLSKRKGVSNPLNSIKLRGRKQPNELVEKRRKSNLGKKRSEQSRTNMSLAQLKASPHKINYKGGISRNKSEYERQRITKKLIEKSGTDKPEYCTICGSFGNICFDHDHITGFFRGWICKRCNLTLGLVKDSTDLLKMMILYLNK